MLEQGFEEDLRGIVKALPSQRQTALFSATQTRKVEDLARLAIKTDPVYVGVHDSEQHATVAGLEQGYVVVAPKDRFRLLFTFLKRHRKKEKVMVFFSSCNAVKYYSDLLNYVDVPVQRRRPVDTFIRVDGVPEHAQRRVDGVRAASRRWLTGRGGGPCGRVDVTEPSVIARPQAGARTAAATRAEEVEALARAAAAPREQTHDVERRRRGGRTPSTRPRGRESARNRRPTRGRSRGERASGGRGAARPRRDNATHSETTTRETPQKKTHTGPRHPRPPEAAEAHVDVLRIL